MTNLNQFTPSQRTRALFYFFGWQGGTIHQLAHETGIDSETILHGVVAHDSNGGFSAIRTCGRDWRRGTLAPKHKGDWPFYAAAISGFWATGALDGLGDRYPEHARI